MICSNRINRGTFPNEITEWLDIVEVLLIDVLLGFEEGQIEHQSVH